MAPVDSNYAGYGIDCSGLVSAAARWAGYNWNPWRANTKMLAYGPDKIPGTPDDFYYSIPIDNTRIDTDLNPGDILNKPRFHVVTVYYFSGNKDTEDNKVIEASGSADKVRIRESVNIQTQYLEKGYTARRLIFH